MPIITVNHLVKNFQAYKKDPGLFGSVKSLLHRQHYKVPAVKDVSFSINEGEFVGFIGSNGAGKTTTLKMLSGLIHPSEGKVQVIGYKPFERKIEFLTQISLVMGQKNQLWWDLPASESFLLNKEIYEIPDLQFKQTLSSLTELLDVGEILNVQVRKLSLGQRMKCELIAALLHSPKVLFLDEPTIGLDVVMQQNLRDFIKQYNKKYNATIILTSHYRQDVKELCDRIIVIDHGQILYNGKLESIIKQFASHKILSIILSKEIDKKELEKLGTIKEYEYPRVKLEVPLDKSNHTAAHILNTFPVKDLNIEEPDIENIIRLVFTQ
jgi:ABC-2 type transport system ATP-binding protein